MLVKKMKSMGGNIRTANLFFRVQVVSLACMCVLGSATLFFPREAFELETQSLQMVLLMLIVPLSIWLFAW